MERTGEIVPHTYVQVNANFRVQKSSSIQIPDPIVFFSTVRYRCFNLLFFKLLSPNFCWCPPGGYWVLNIMELLRLFYPKATFLTLRGSLRPLRRVAARALDCFAVCATSLRASLFGACVWRAPSESVSVYSVVKNPASNLTSQNHPQPPR